MIDEIKDYWPDDSSSQGESNAPSEQPRSEEYTKPALLVNTQEGRDRRKVFVVHGRNHKIRNSLFAFLRAIGLNPIEWSQAVKGTGQSSPYVGDILDDVFSKAQAVLVLLTPDDRAFLRESLRKPNDPPYESVPTLQARPNVLFEAGMAMGRFPNRTVLVEVGDLRPFSDIGGRLIVKLNDSTERRQELAQRLENAGCSIDLSGTDWHREGSFNI
jgi:predicted nucleotide-binding protein